MNFELFARALDHSRSSGAARLVLFTLCYHANESGAAWPGVPTLARETRLTERAVQKGLPQLETLKEIRRTGRSGTSARYAVTLKTAPKKGEPRSPGAELNSPGRVNPFTTLRTTLTPRVNHVHPDYALNMQ